MRPPSPHTNKPRPRWQQPNWPSLTNKVKSWGIPPPPEAPFPNQFDQWFSPALSAIRTTIEATAPRSRPSSKSQPWGTPLLTTLRREFTKATRMAKKLRTPNSYTIATQSKLSYFKAFQKSKSLLLGGYPCKNLPEQHLDGQAPARSKNNLQISLPPSRLGPGRNK